MTTTTAEVTIIDRTGSAIRMLMQTGDRQHVLTVASAIDDCALWVTSEQWMK